MPIYRLRSLQTARRGRHECGSLAGLSIWWNLAACVLSPGVPDAFKGAAFGTKYRLMQSLFSRSIARPSG
ncbi:MAG: hypothetical protein IT425_06255 [Pirellulales bacterium]|nr:hypothetical protein [Pirellulales bacterium]